MEHKRERLLDEVFDFSPDEGLIRLREQRVVILSAAAMGLLRKELIQTLGAPTARRVLLRFGFADGYHDAINLKDQWGWADPLDGVRASASVHALEGIVRAEFTRLELDPVSGAFESELTWRRSYEGEQHLEHYGRGDDPVCWSLVGYISGYVSAALGLEAYFRETQCVGQGHRECRLVGRHAGGWGADLDGFRFDFQGADLGAEVERLRVAATRQRQALAVRERALLRREREMDALQQRVAEHVARQRFVVRSPQMRGVLDLASRVAPLDTTVLVTGESGTGKEFIVRLVHAHSARSGGPLVSVNCAALTETLLESELFGHVRGAFTGAVRDKAGLFEVATDGTLFLDEIGEMAPTVQAKLLRALQEGEIRRVGSERDIRVRPRIVTATNRDLRATIAEGRFREDLYFRLAGFVIAIPPLRERAEDIPALAQEFLRRTASRLAKDVKALSSQAMVALVSYPWPGNVRELEHAIERAVILSHGPVLSIDDLPPEVRTVAPRGGPAGDLDVGAARRAMVEEALRRHPRSRKAAAAALGVSTVTLWRMMKRYGLIARAEGPGGPGGTGR